MGVKLSKKSQVPWSIQSFPTIFLTTTILPRQTSWMLSLLVMTFKAPPDVVTRTKVGRRAAVDRPAPLSSLPEKTHLRILMPFFQNGMDIIYVHCIFMSNCRILAGYKSFFLHNLISKTVVQYFTFCITTKIVIKKLS